MAKAMKVSMKKTVLSMKAMMVAAKATKAAAKATKVAAKAMKVAAKASRIANPSRSPSSSLVGLPMAANEAVASCILFRAESPTVQLLAVGELKFTDNIMDHMIPPPFDVENNMLKFATEHMGFMKHMKQQKGGIQNGASPRWFNEAVKLTAKGDLVDLWGSRVPRELIGLVSCSVCAAITTKLGAHLCLWCAKFHENGDESAGSKSRIYWVCHKCDPKAFRYHCGHCHIPIFDCDIQDNVNVRPQEPHNRICCETCSRTVYFNYTGV
jgi:hypothetical protein